MSSLIAASSNGRTSSRSKINGWGPVRSSAKHPDDGAHAKFAQLDDVVHA